VITVHDRALFDYLTRKLSPAFHSDILAVEITRSFVLLFALSLAQAPVRTIG
jgi:hypothetical protein